MRKLPLTESLLQNTTSLERVMQSDYREIYFLVLQRALTPWTKTFLTSLLVLMNTKASLGTASQASDFWSYLCFTEEENSSSTHSIHKHTHISTVTERRTDYVCVYSRRLVFLPQRQTEGSVGTEYEAKLRHGRRHFY